MKQPLAILAVLLAIGAGAWLATRDTAEQVAPGDGPLVDIVVPELDATARVGKSAFDANCAVCHGTNATGREGKGPPLVHKIYEPSHHGDFAFVRAAVQGVRSHHWPFGDMPAVPGVTQDDVVPIIAYVRALQRANGIH